MSAHPRPRLTPEEYLAIERAAPTKSEYYQGLMYAMSGASWAHNRITTNLGAELRTALKSQGCDVSTSDLRVRVSPDGLYAYPDVVVLCEQARFADNQTDTLLNPTLLIEVLSPSTEAYDRGFKSAQYRTITSLQEYALVSQNEPRVEIYRRQTGGGWHFSEAIGLDASCRFEHLSCSIPLSEIFYRVIFDTPPAPQTAP